MSGEAYDPGSDGARMALADAMSYGDYLKLDRVLSQQHPLSDAHDEMLFIIQHQTSELWMKLAIHELVAARDALRMGRTAQVSKMLARVSRIFEQLNSAWDVLRTMTPADCLTSAPMGRADTCARGWPSRRLLASSGSDTDMSRRIRTGRRATGGAGAAVSAHPGARGPFPVAVARTAWPGGLRTRRVAPFGTRPRCLAHPRGFRRPGRARWGLAAAGVGGRVGEDAASS